MSGPSFGRRRQKNGLKDIVLLRVQCGGVATTLKLPCIIMELKSSGRGSNLVKKNEVILACQDQREVDVETGARSKGGGQYVHGTPGRLSGR